MQSKPKLASTVEQVRKLRVDALYGKKKHFNAAERKDKLRLWLNLPVIVINIALGSLLFSILQAESPLVFKWTAAVLLFLAATLTGVSTFFDHAKQVEGHRRVGNKYIAVVKGCDRLIAYYQDGLVQETEVKTRLEELATAADDANREAEAFSTSPADYKKAQAGIQAGEEEYLPIELGR